ncbi:putative quinol monooxygenase [Acetobacter peroxydans]|jgi:quinol monooxygenase YgiN|uniref:putative quinol monooxygenase n=1 Tax=Acetobacter peroxydans TaxID=104098 RepID=UPI002357FEA9|nr:antibiotic biosynthesis monooxygenase [Acetobacter peroxydans]MCH4143830.1 antibiotic biosynthesis monooxygenase [Acetobacter peroxydans]MCI1411371.1 antibiotic biosynthesis monooxygenase [Acetobacter peroxydans]MCI1439758.1 antibiotic biosynthesis monooxygenase [Acetobacter peroxydans]MCI1566468.1 antibiotic biosynthesis monooxygenase [Acetobacter peroxydans]MCI1618683.1 antibiotic biosynthesis monooxygenase [Acetobacter peroxydans]
MSRPVTALTRRQALGAAVAYAVAPSIGRAATKTAPVRIVTLLPVKPPELTRFLPVMKENARLARAHPGNQTFGVFMDTESPATLYLFESWDSLPDLADFMKTDAQQTLASLEQSTLSSQALSLHLSDVSDTPAYDNPALESTEDAQTLMIRFQVRPGERAAFMSAFHDVIPVVRADRNTEAYDLFRVAGRPDNFVLMGRWHDMATYEKYERLPCIRKLHQILPAMLKRASERHELRDVML